MGSSLEPQCTDDHLTIFLSTEYDAPQIGVPNVLQWYTKNGIMIVLQSHLLDPTYLI